jgi:hypothetical protein
MQRRCDDWMSLVNKSGLANDTAGLHTTHPEGYSHTGRNCDDAGCSKFLWNQPRSEDHVGQRLSDHVDEKARILNEGAIRLQTSFP